jgi:hypothetical protein
MPFAPTLHGLMRRLIRISAAAAMFDAARKLATSQELVRGLYQRNSGRFGGSITVRPAGSMDGVEVRLART